MTFSRLKNILFIALFFSSCTIIRKAPKDRPYLYKNTIQLNGGKFTALEKEAVMQRLNNQLDDSSKVSTKDAFFFLHFVNKPVAYDTAYSAISAFNMQSSMNHLGYYNAKGSYTQDTIGRKVYVKYTVDAGKPTLIDTVRYKLVKPELEELALKSKNDALLVENNPITKTAVLAEINRLVDSFRNNGYYKFTAAELRVRGDTTIAALTTVTDDPFEQLQLLQEAQQKKDSPEIKLAVMLVQPDDTTKLNKYYINKIYILSDFRPTDNIFDTTNITQRESRSKAFTLRYHDPIFRTALFQRNVTMRSGDVYRQFEYYKTLSNLTNLGVWQSVNIRLVENIDEPNKVDLVFELIPAKKFGFETSLEASYSATSNTNTSLGGNLFGFSTNFSLVNRNIGREAIKMTHSIRAGVELNNNSKGNTGNLINSNELGYSNNVSFPRIVSPFRSFNRKKMVSSESFINLNLSLNNRLNLFSLQSVNLNYGYLWTSKKNRQWSFRPLNAEFSYLFNQSDSFKNVVLANPFLRYSYNTSFVLGMAGSFATSYSNPVHAKSLSRIRNLKFTAEESGLTYGLLPIFKKYKRTYLKLDGEYKYTVSYPNNKAIAVRAYAGVGIPLAGDTSLPFFKQFFGGGSNSMRGWPVRGIGRGGQKLTPFRSGLFNDRTGDMQLEANFEYRYNIARIIPDLLTLKGALFIDAGNIWNLKDSRPGGVTDSAQFKFQNLYKELGISAGTGFRLDFNYLTLRFDFGFRFKRPELSYINSGWKAPTIGFNDAFQKLFNKDYREWRYENFNFTIGINYPF
jgi:outer membrane protein insertion porin family